MPRRGNVETNLVHWLVGMVTPAVSKTPTGSKMVLVSCIFNHFFEYLSQVLHFLRIFTTFFLPRCLVLSKFKYFVFGVASLCQINLNVLGNKMLRTHHWATDILFIFILLWICEMLLFWCAFFPTFLVIWGLQLTSHWQNAWNSLMAEQTANNTSIIHFSRTYQSTVVFLVLPCPPLCWSGLFPPRKK